MEASGPDLAAPGTAAGEALRRARLSPELLAGLLLLLVGLTVAVLILTGAVNPSSAP